MSAKTAAKKKGLLEIRADLCKECGYCVECCKRESIAFSPKINAKGYRPAVFIVDSDCNACGICAVVCPEAAIEVYSE